MMASCAGFTEIVKMLLEHKGIDVNAKDIYLLLPIFQLIFQYFKIIIGI